MDISNVAQDYGQPFKYRGASKVLESHDELMTGLLQNNMSHLTSTEEENVKDLSDSNAESDCSSKRKPIVISADKSSSCPLGRAKEDASRLKCTEKKLRLAAKSIETEKERNQVPKRHYGIMLFVNASLECDKNQSI